MKKIFLILPFLLIGTAHAASMCVPNMKSATTYTHMTAEENSRGIFVNGTSCSGDFCQNTAFKGEGACSIAPMLPANNFGTTGPYCYCRITHIRAPNGYLASYNGAWVFLGKVASAFDAPSCRYGCAYFCMTNSKILRNAMYISLIESE